MNDKTTAGQANNPLHGITLEMMLNEMVEKEGWDAMASRIDIRCFKNDPSIKSSLRFLRKTPWARAKFEAYYCEVKGF
ncbi:VF530 family DNA-binding protein [Pokkaliibacter sp. CJK22405]|uniref:VF530 family protein n=1 Tax=Pokkaliibacter sp. CJK22405 TaxID=3384615 RepID=UPI003984D8E9